MEIKFRDISAENIRTDLLVLAVPEKQWDEAPLRALDRRLKGKLRERLQNSKFTGSEGSSLLLPTLGLLPSAHLLIIGSGGAKEMDSDSWRKSAARARKEAANLGASDIALFFPGQRGCAGGWRGHH